MRGRKPQPTALKILRGNPGKRPLNAEEPKLPIATDQKPPLPLDGAGKREWNRLIEHVQASGLLTTGDVMPFWTYCWFVGKVAEFEQLVRKVGTKEAHSLGYLSKVVSLQKDMLKAAVECGLTPSSRSRVKATKPAAAKADTTRRFFGDSRAQA